MRPGRVQVVTTEVKECQVAFMDGNEARDYASNGDVTPFPSIPRDGAPLTVQEEREGVVEGEVVGDSDLGQQPEGNLALTGPEQAADPGHMWLDPNHDPKSDPDWGTVRDIVPLLSNGKTAEAVKMDIKRDPNFPHKHPHKGGRDSWYHLDSVLLYYAKRPKRNGKAA